MDERPDPINVSKMTKEERSKYFGTLALDGLTYAAKERTAKKIMEDWAKTMEETRKRMEVKTTYTIDIEDYIIEYIRKDWEPTFAKHNMTFDVPGAVRSILRGYADKIMRKKSGLARRKKARQNRKKNGVHKSI